AFYAQQRPGGNITFYDNGNVIPIGNSTSVSYTFTQVGTHNITASYSGDSNYLGSSVTTPVQLVIEDQIPSVARSVFASLNPTITNYPVQLQASFGAPQSNSPTLTGTVTFTDNGVPISGN